MDIHVLGFVWTYIFNSLASVIAESYNNSVSNILHNCHTFYPKHLLHFSFSPTSSAWKCQFAHSFTNTIICLFDYSLEGVKWYCGFDWHFHGS